MHTFTLKTYNSFDPLATPTPSPASLPTRPPLSYTLRPLPPALTLPQRISPCPRAPKIRKRATRGRLGDAEALRALVLQGGERGAEGAEGAEEVGGWDWDWIRGYVESPRGAAVEAYSLAEELDRLVLDDETRGLVESWRSFGCEELEEGESDDCGTVIYSPGDGEEDDD